MPARRPLRGWKEIAQYLGTSERTAQRWEREAGLPVHRVRNTPGATVFASANELDVWRTSPPGRIAGSTAEEDAVAAPVGHEEERPEYGASRRRRIWSRRRLAIAAAVVLIAVAVVVAEVVRHAPTSPRSVQSALRAGRSNSTNATIVIVLKVTESSGQPFICRVLSGGAVRISDRHKPLSLTPAVEASADRIRLTSAVAERPGADPETTGVRTELRRAEATMIDVGGEKLQVEWLDTETPQAAPTSGDTASDNCALECGPTTVQALQVSSGCGSCCGLKFAGCRR